MHLKTFLLILIYQYKIDQQNSIYVHKMVINLELFLIKCPSMESMVYLSEQRMGKYRLVVQIIIIKAVLNLILTDLLSVKIILFKPYLLKWETIIYLVVSFNPE